MKKLTLAVLLLTACRTPTPKEETPPAPEPVCLQPKEIVTVVKESCGFIATFTPSVDQTVPGVAICVLDPAAKAMLCMTPKEAAERAERGGSLTPETLAPTISP